MSGNLYRSVIAKTKARQLSGKLAGRFATNAPTWQAGASGPGLVRIGDQLYDSTSAQADGPIAVVNAGRPAAAVYAPTTGAGTLISRSTGAGGSTGGGSAVLYHNQLLGLTAGDDHPHYLNTYRGDSRYVPLTRQVDALAPLSVTPPGGALTYNLLLSLDLAAADPGLEIDPVSLGLQLGAPLDIAINSASATSGAGHGHAIITSSNPGAAAAILASSAAGRLTLPEFIATSAIGINNADPQYDLDAAGTVNAQTALQSPRVQTGAGDLTMAPAGSLIRLANDKAIQSNAYASGFAGYGWRIDEGITTAGAASAEFDDLTIRGRMRVYELLIQQIRATNGSIFVSSTGKAATVTDNGGGSYTITTDPETEHGFLTGDLIRAQRFTGSGIYRSDLTVTSVTDTATFTATLRAGADAPAAGMEFVRLGSTTDASRRGSIYLTADDAGAPYIDVVNGIAAFTDWNTAGKIKMRIGRLDGITGGSQEYGLIAGLAGFTSADQWIKVSSTAAQLNNIPIAAYSGGNQTAELSAAGRLRIGTNIAAGNTTFVDANPAAGTVQIGNSTNPGAVTIYGQINIAAGGNAATTSYADGVAGTAQSNAQSYAAALPRAGSATAGGSANDTAAVGGTAAATVRDNAARAAAGLDASGNVKRPLSGSYITGSPVTGLNMTASGIGYYDGANWRTYLDNAGNLALGSTTGARLEYNRSANELRGLNSGGSAQWYADGDDGKLYTGGGNVILDAAGITTIAYHDKRTTTPEPGYSTPISTPVAQILYKATDAADSFTSAVDGTFVYNGGYALRLFASSRHAVDSGNYASTWSHYIDAVLEHPGVSYPAGSGQWYQRLWLRAPSTDLVLSGGLATLNGNTIWHAGNDGAGTGLDADTLDTYQAADFARLTGATFTGIVYGSVSASGTGGSPLRFPTAGALAASTNNDQMIFYHIADNEFGILVGDSAAYRTLHLQPLGGAVHVGGGASTVLRVGNTADYYSAKIQTNGNIHAAGAITAGTYMQITSGSNPGGATGFVRLWYDGNLRATLPDGTTRTFTWASP